MKTQLEAIRNIDLNAARYLETVVLPRYSEKDLKRLLGKKSIWKPKNKGMDLLDLFIWGQTEHGWDYWKNIWRELNGK